MFITDKKSRIIAEILGLVEYFGSPDDALYYVQKTKSPRALKKAKKQTVRLLRKYIRMCGGV